MIKKDQIREMCIPPDTGKAYYRPFTCRGEIKEDGIFFVGINPATPITPEDELHELKEHLGVTQEAVECPVK